MDRNRLACQNQCNTPDLAISRTCSYTLEFGSFACRQADLLGAPEIFQIPTCTTTPPPKLVEQTRHQHQALTDSCGTSEHLIYIAVIVHHGPSPGQSTGCPGALHRPRNHHEVALSPIPRRPHHQSYLRSRHIHIHRAPPDTRHCFTAIPRYASRHESLFDFARDLQLWHIRRVQE
jgi:hypothetical protein